MKRKFNRKQNAKNKAHMHQHISLANSGMHCIQRQKFFSDNSWKRSINSQQATKSKLQYSLQVNTVYRFLNEDID